MENKIVIAATTILMLILCIVAGVGLSTIMSLKNMDLVEDRASSMVVSQSGEVTANNRIVLRGSDLISTIIGMDTIDDSIPDLKEKIYQYPTRDIKDNITGKVTTEWAPKYIFNFGADTYDDKRDVIEVVSNSGINDIYYVEYRDNSGNPINDLTHIGEGIDEIYIDISKAG